MAATDDAAALNWASTAPLLAGGRTTALPVLRLKPRCGICCCRHAGHSVACLCHGCLSCSVSHQSFCCFTFLASVLNLWLVCRTWLLHSVCLGDFVSAQCSAHHRVLCLIPSCKPHFFIHVQSRISAFYRLLCQPWPQTSPTPCGRSRSRP